MNCFIQEFGLGARMGERGGLRRDDLWWWSNVGELWQEPDCSNIVGRTLKLSPEREEHCCVALAYKEEKAGGRIYLCLSSFSRYCHLICFPIIFSLTHSSHNNKTLYIR